jgi:hypothetical protein
LSIGERAFSAAFSLSLVGFFSSAIVVVVVGGDGCFAEEAEAKKGKQLNNRRRNKPDKNDMYVRSSVGTAPFVFSFGFFAFFCFFAPSPMLVVDVDDVSPFAATTFDAFDDDETLFGRSVASSSLSSGLADVVVDFDLVVIVVDCVGDDVDDFAGFDADDDDEVAADNRSISPSSLSPNNDDDVDVVDDDGDFSLSCFADAGFSIGLSTDFALDDDDDDDDDFTP